MTAKYYKQSEISNFSREQWRHLAHDQYKELVIFHQNLILTICSDTLQNGSLDIYTQSPNDNESRLVIQNPQNTKI